MPVPKRSWQQLRSKIVRMAEEDDEMRDELVEEGVLFLGYHPKMEEVHCRNADILTAWIEDLGFPNQKNLGDSFPAFWQIIHHAISRPNLIRLGLEWSRHAVDQGGCPPELYAYLEDRVRFFEGRPQLFGTQFDWNQKGQLDAGEIEDRKNLDKRRKIFGLAPFQKARKEILESARRDGERAPKDWEHKRAEFLKWARRVGWRVGA